jgi:ferritin-like metal-binding protein YciE
MTQSQRKIAQYLGEANAMEMGLIRDLQAQIAMTPRGAYRNALQGHLKETREHARRVQSRLREVGGGRGIDPVGAAVGLAESVVSQALALGKAPLALARGQSAEEKVLKNAKEACASEALEIATYTAIEELARAVGDEQTAKMAVAIRREEERMLERVLGELPGLAGAVVGIEIGREDEGRDARGERDHGRGRVRGGERDHGGERRRSAAGGRGRNGSRDGEPWPGYDEQTVEEIRKALEEADERRAKEVRSYERSHKKRSGVIEATEAGSHRAA